MVYERKKMFVPVKMNTNQPIMYMTLGSMVTLIVLYMMGQFKMIEKYSPDKFEEELKNLLRDMQTDEELLK